jgi:hypothetical protein
MSLSLNFICSLKIKAVCIGIVNLILLMLLFSDHERSVNASSLLSLIFRLSMSRRDEACATVITFSFLRGTEMLLNIYQGVNASAKHDQKQILLTH